MWLGFDICPQRLFTCMVVNFLDYCGTLATNGTRRLTGGKYLWVALYDWYGRAKVGCGFVKSSDGLIC